VARKEFTRDVYAAIVRRATNEHGYVTCEGCGLVLGKKPYHIDHTIADALILTKRRLTEADGQLLGAECCHAGKTAQDQGIIAKVKRQEARSAGIKRPTGDLKGKPFPKSPKTEKAPQRASLPRRSLYARKP
jgi:hypothetical protein